MIRKTTKLCKSKLFTFCILLILCVSLIFNNQNTMEACYALSSWSPNGGFQPGISATLPGDVIDTPILIPPNIDTILSVTDETLLYARDSLKVSNIAKSFTWGDYAYLKFVDYFTIKREDGRKIYSASTNYLEDYDVVSYKASLSLKQNEMESNNDGFFWTAQRAKWESGAYYLEFCRAEDPDDCWEFNLSDDNSSQSGINPGSKTVNLGCFNNGDDSLPYSQEGFSTVEFYGKAYWHNEFWGNTWNAQTVSATMTPKIYNTWRDWSNTLKPVDEHVVVDGTNMYSASPFAVIASNLNNYVKYNDEKITANVNSEIRAYYSGFRIAITDYDKTKVSIENGAENKYTDYNCIIDSKIPDINLTYLNTNAFDRLKENAVQTDANNIQTQLVTGGIFKDQVQVNFGADEDESPERCYVTYNGQTKEITSGTWLSGAGDYTIIVQDLVGNAKTMKFTIDSSNPSNNVDRLENQTTYKVSKWYLTTIPYGFTESGTYSYLTYGEALKKATQCERTNMVTNYELKSIEDFHYSNLVASGDSVKVGPYWYYKSKENSNIYVYYFNENLLNEAIEKYAINYISSPQYFNYKPDIYPNDYGNVIDNKIYHNLWNEDTTPAYISNNFIFRQTDEQESYKIYYDYIEDGLNGFTELMYNVLFTNQVSGHGLYLIKEIDYVGHETFCYVFLDLQAPVLDVTAKIYGANDSFSHTISKNDIPANGDLIFYYEDFNINQIIDDDTWYVLQIKSPDGNIKRYTYLDTLPNFAEQETGEYMITTYDRIGNNFSFKMCLLGKAPKVKFETINANEQLKISITSGEQYNEVMGINIYRNDKLLNSEIGYDEYPDDSTNELIFINVENKQYTFNKGGLYKVEITDNFGRTTMHEFKFDKDLPQGILKGVKHNGKTNNSVQFIYNASKYVAVVYENDNQINAQSELDSSGILTTLNIVAVYNINNEYKIMLHDINDFENLNQYKFTIKTTKPQLTLNGVIEDGTTSSDVYAVWEIQSGYSAVYKLNNGDEIPYINGQVLTSEGIYQITLTDDLGNKTTKQFEIDKSLDFSIYEENILKKIEEIEFTNKNIQIVNNEPLNIEIIKDEKQYEYEFGTYFNDEGSYLVKISDEYGNAKYFAFEIDKTNPIASLIGVENNKITSGFVQVVWEEENLTGLLYKDNNYIGNYNSGTEIKLNGNYEIVVKDRAQNMTKFNFKIDNKIEFEINTFKGGISNGGVRVLAKEELTIEMYKDANKIDYNFEQILNEDGYYEFILTDTLGNQVVFNFYIWNKPMNRIDMKLDKSVTIMEIQKDKEIQELDIQDNTLYLVDEAMYKVTVFDKTVNKYFDFNLQIDTTPPSIQLIGVENNGQTKSEVTTRNPSETPITIEAITNDKEFEYSLGDKIKNAGSYELIVRDVAGNETKYTFTVIYAFNGATIALFGGMLAIVVLLIIFLVNSKRGFYKANQEITTTEETIEEIDNIEQK